MFFKMKEIKKIEAYEDDLSIVRVVGKRTRDVIVVRIKALGDMFTVERVDERLYKGNFVPLFPIQKQVTEKLKPAFFILSFHHVGASITLKEVEFSE